MIGMLYDWNSLWSEIDSIHQTFIAHSQSILQPEWEIWPVVLPTSLLASYYLLILDTLPDASYMLNTCTSRTTAICLHACYKGWNRGHHPSYLDLDSRTYISRQQDRKTVSLLVCSCGAILYLNTHLALPSLSYPRFFKVALSLQKSNHNERSFPFSFLTDN